MKVLYVNLQPSDLHNSEQLWKKQQHSLLYKIELAKDARVHYFLRNSQRLNCRFGNLQVNAFNLSPVLFVFRVMAHILRYRIGILILHNLDNFAYTAFFRLVPGLKIILQHHGEKTWLRKKGKLMRLTSPFVWAYFFNGKGLAAPFARKGCLNMSKVREVTEGTTAFELPMPAFNRVKKLIFIGRLDGNKDPETLLKALSLLKGEWEIDVYYSTSKLLEELRDFCQVNGMSDRVRFMGHVSSDEIRKALGHSDIFISCSHEESGGYALVEALACGVYPVVTEIAAFDFLLEGLAYKSQFRIADAGQLAEQLRVALTMNIDAPVRAAIRSHFEKIASAAAIAAQIKAAIKGTAD